MDELLAGLRAAAESTRIRILFSLSHGEFNVSELTRILGQSQPRVSRHLKLMTEAGLITRHKEGNWVLFRLSEEQLGGALARAIVTLLKAPDLAQDLVKLEQIRAERAEAASRYFQENASRWDELRKLHQSEEEVAAAMLRLAGREAIDFHLDLGTGTGRVLRDFARLSKQSLGIDSSRDMLAIARVSLEKARLKHIQIRHGDIYALPLANSACDFITIHQVLHYLDDPALALLEAARVLKPAGRLLIADFAPHELEELRDKHAHRRLGIAAEHMTSWLHRSGLTLKRHEVLPPPWRRDGTGLTVSLWLAAKPAPASTSKAAMDSMQ